MHFRVEQEREKGREGDIRVIQYSGHHLETSLAARSIQSDRPKSDSLKVRQFGRQAVGQSYINTFRQSASKGV